MRAFNFDRSAIIAAALQSRLASRRSALAPIAFLLVILILSMGLVMASAQAQTSSGTPGRRTTKPIKSPVSVSSVGVTDSVGDAPSPPQAAETFVFVGSYRLSNGPYWAAAPP